MNTRSSFVQAHQIHSTFSCCVSLWCYAALSTARLSAAATFSWMAAAGTMNVSRMRCCDYVVHDDENGREHLFR